MQAMLLAAGFGTRLRPYTLVRPKPLFPVLNRPLLQILLDMLAWAGCSRIVVNGHHLAAQVEQAVAGRENLAYQYEPEILGTGGSLRQALPLFSNEPVIVMNSDIFHTINLSDLYREHLLSGNRITMAMHDLPRFNTVGVSDGYIRTFSPDSDRNGMEMLAFTGIHIVDPSIIRMIPAGRYFHVIDLYEQLARQGERIGFHRVDGAWWHDIGTAEDYLDLHGVLLTGTEKPQLPVTIPDGSWLIDSRIKVPDSTRFFGWGCIGNAVVGRDVSLRNCVVWDNAHIKDGARLENVIVTPPAAALIEQ